MTKEIVEIDVAPHLELGRRGERLALEYLKIWGYRIVVMNFVTRLGRNLAGRPLTGEIDIVAYDGATLCFIEVKTRRSDGFAAPEEAVDGDKQRQLRRTARRYLKMFGIRNCQYRFDVVAIVWPTGGSPAISLKRAFFNSVRERKAPD